LADTVSTKRRSEIMSNIRSKDTSIEVKVRKWLFSQGFRYRSNDKRYPGKPDIVLPKYKTVIFIHGCFWHGHGTCRYSHTPKTRVEYWNDKISNNIQRDKRHKAALEEMGWRVLTLWECEIKSHFEERMSELKCQIENE